MVERDAQVGGDRWAPGRFDRQAEHLRGRIDESIERIGPGRRGFARFCVPGRLGSPAFGRATLRLFWRGARLADWLTRHCLVVLGNDRLLRTASGRMTT